MPDNSAPLPSTPTADPSTPLVRYDSFEVGDALFVRHLLARVDALGARHSARAELSFDTQRARGRDVAARAVAALGEQWQLVASKEDAGAVELVVASDADGVVALFETGKSLVCTFFRRAPWGAGDSPELAAVRAALKDVLQERVAPERVRVTFWSHGSTGARQSYQQHQRMIASPAWESIRGNYPVEVARRVDWLLGLARPWEQGRIVLWHGPAGTGKTHAIRALLRAWSGLSANVVMDPEVFFNNPQYLNSVLLTEPDDAEGETAGPAQGMVVVLEDAAEFILRESRAQHGFDVARLLNVADGIMGSGVNVVFLVTTNEPLGKVDDAVTRPGRALQSLEFRALSAADADHWARSHGLAQTFPHGATFAEPFGALRASEAGAAGDPEPPPRPEAPLGFSTAPRG
jgi:hypothetical protein